MQFGKVENLRRAAALFDGSTIPEGGVFSFWKQLGRPSRRRGFVAGRMLQGRLPGGLDRRRPLSDI